MQDGTVGQTATETQVANQMRQSAAAARTQGNLQWATQLEAWATQLETDPATGGYGSQYAPQPYSPLLDLYSYYPYGYSIFHPINTFLPTISPFGGRTVAITTTMR